MAAAAAAAAVAVARGGGIGELRIDVRRHATYCAATLTLPVGGDAKLRAEYTSADAQRMTLVYFSVAALDVLGVLGEVVDAAAAAAICDWIYTCQVPRGARLLPATTDSSPPLLFRGFDGGSFAGWTGTAPDGTCNTCLSGNVAMSYAAVATLLLLGDDLSRLDTAAIAATLATLQLPDGNVRTHGPGAEADARFVYSAVVLATLLRLPRTALDFDAAARFLAACQAPDGGFGLVPGNEGHGGSTYCAVAALALIDTYFPSPAAAAPFAATPAGALARRWCCWRQRDMGLSDDATLCGAARRVALDSLRASRPVGVASAAAVAAPAPATTAATSASDSSSGGAVGGAGSAVPVAAAADAAATAAGPESDSDSSDGSGDGSDRDDALPPEVRVALAGPGGITGRPGKPSDSCYSFWIGGSLAALGVPVAATFDGASLASFLSSCQFPKGGFGKDCEAYPDPMHTYYALAGLSLAGHPQLQPIDAALGLSTRAVAAWRAAAT